MSKTEEEIYETFPENRPHSTKEYVEWMANVWRLNGARNAMVSEQKKKQMMTVKNVKNSVSSTDYTL